MGKSSKEHLDQRMVVSVEGNLSPDFERAGSPAKADGKRVEVTKAVSSFANPAPSRILPFLAALAWLLIAGCAVGPDFKRPAAPAVSDYTARPLSTTVTSTNVAGGEAQRFAKGSDIAGDWWTLFHSKPLNELIEHSLTNNPDLKAAQAALSVARENVLAQRGAYYPSVAAAFSASRQKQSGTLAPDCPAQTCFNTICSPRRSAFRMSPDVFGLNRRTVESVESAGTGSAFPNDRDVYHADRQCGGHGDSGGRRCRRRLTRPASSSASTPTWFKSCNTNWPKAMPAGLIWPRRNRNSRKSPPRCRRCSSNRPSCATCWRFWPADFRTRRPTKNSSLRACNCRQELPVSLPSQLVAQRPDVLQAEANLHAASAQIGIATANRLPNITLTANAGSTALALDQVFTSGTGFWGLGAAATAPIFQGGTLLHQERAAKAAYVQAAEQYRSTVLTAFQNVADTLTALEQDAEL